MIGRWFGKSKKRISAEEFSQILARVAQEYDEASITSRFEELAAEFSPLGISLVRASAVAFAWHARGPLQRLPPDRFEALRETYYEKVWEGIVLRFGPEKAQYNEFVRRLGGFAIPDECKTDFARRVHDVLGEAVKLICPAANEYLAASDSDKGAAAIALGEAVGRVLFGGRTDLNASRVLVAHYVFNATARAVTGFLHELEGDGLQVF